ncbi:MAG: fused MFS/spermidine synthase, partial [Patescibacteria group bacterium]
ILGFRGSRTKTRVGLLLLLIAVSAGQYRTQQQAEASGFIDVDSSYNRISVEERTFPGFEAPMRAMMISGELNSAMFLDSNDLALPYTEYYRLARHFTPKIESTLMLGAGGYSYPKDFLASFPSATMDVVEIDPKTTELARKYFNLKDSPRLTIYHEDGRTFLNKSQKKYDVIYGDAFSSFYSIPYELTTKESVEHMYRLLNDGGVALINIISSLDGPKGKFLASEYRTFREVFPQVYLFPVDDKSQTLKVQNIMLVAMKSNDPPALSSDDAALTHYLTKLWVGVLSKDAPILTDDYAPADQFVAAMANDR